MITRGYCRSESRLTSWSFSGYATSDAAENAVRPRAFTQSCVSCRAVVLTLGYALPGYVHDADGLAKAVLKEWLRKAGPATDKIDADNVLGDLRAHVWHLYNRWLPGGLTFTSYATGILRRKINTFVARDVGDADADGRYRKAHSRTTSVSYERLGPERATERLHTSERGGLDYTLGLVEVDSTGSSYADSSWFYAVRDRADNGVEVETSGAAARTVAS